MSKRVLVTGATGFIGRALLAELQKKNLDARSLTGDIRSINQSGSGSDLVFHLAGVTGDDRFAKDAVESFDINVGGTQAVLDYCARHKASCVFASTSGVYIEPPVGEKVTEESPLRGTRPYALSKVIGEKLCRLAFENRGVSTTVLRIFNVYGPGQRQPFLIPYLVESIAQNKPLELRMPHAIRDFVNIQDVVDAFMGCVDGPNGFHIFNIGSGNGARVSDVVKTIESLLSKTSKSETVGGHAGELGHILADSSAAQKSLGWTCKISLQQGLQEIISGVNA